MGQHNQYYSCHFLTNSQIIKLQVYENKYNPNATLQRVPLAVRKIKEMKWWKLESNLIIWFYFCRVTHAGQVVRGQGLDSREHKPGFPVWNHTEQVESLTLKSRTANISITACGMFYLFCFVIIQSVSSCCETPNVGRTSRWSPQNRNDTGKQFVPNVLSFQASRHEVKSFSLRADVIPDVSRFGDV